MKIGDSTIVVTGANSGLGKALVDEALRRGANWIYAGARPPFVHSDRRITPLIPDPTSGAIAEGWCSNALKALQRQLSAYVEQTPVKSARGSHQRSTEQLV
jgi:NAD(P)-dependent dehydrogenase (short-subunit alcohol dehydrogenase family)